MKIDLQSQQCDFSTWKFKLRVFRKCGWQGKKTFYISVQFGLIWQIRCYRFLIVRVLRASDSLVHVSGLSIRPLVSSWDSPILPLFCTFQKFFWLCGHFYPIKLYIARKLSILTRQWYQHYNHEVKIVALRLFSVMWNRKCALYWQRVAALQIPVILPQGMLNTAILGVICRISFPVPYHG